MKFDFPEIMHEVPPKEALQAAYGDKWWLARTVASIIVLKTQLSEAQNHRCAHCGWVTNNKPDDRRQATVEHVLAQSRGGKYIFDHCVMACAKCNTRRGDKVLEIEREFFPDHTWRAELRPTSEPKLDRRFIMKRARDSAMVFLKALGQDGTSA